MARIMSRFRFSSSSFMILMAEVTFLIYDSSIRLSLHISTIFHMLRNYGFAAGS